MQDAGCKGGKGPRSGTPWDWGGAKVRGNSASCHPAHHPQVAKADKAQQDQACVKAVGEYRAGLQVHWEKQAPYLAQGLGISLNTFNGLVRTAFRCAREDCDEEERLHPKQAPANMWWEPEDAGTCRAFKARWEGFWQEGFQEDQVYPSLTPTPPPHSPSPHPKPHLRPNQLLPAPCTNGVPYISFEDLKRAHGTPAAKQYVGLKITLYIQMTISLLCGTPAT